MPLLYTDQEVRIGPRAVFETSGTVFPGMDRPRPAKNVTFIVFLCGVLWKEVLCRILIKAVHFNLACARV